MTKTWPGQNTVSPAELVAHYQKEGVLESARYHYETWRKTTAMVGQPAPWSALDTRVQVAICAVAAVMVEVATEDLQMGAKLEAERAENTRLREVISEYARGLRKPINT